MNATTETTDTSDLVAGYVSLIVSCIAFGFMFAPLKKFDCKDGNTFSFCQMDGI